MARYADCIFNEDHFPALGGDFKYQYECQEIIWNAQGIPPSDPRPLETEQQVQKIINLQHIANNLPKAFTDYKGVTKSSYPARNAPKRVEAPIKTIQLPLPKKRGRSTGGGIFIILYYFLSQVLLTRFLVKVFNDVILT